EVGIENIGMFFTVMALCMLAIRPISGKLTDRFGYKLIMIPAIALFAVSFIILGTAKTLAQVLVAAVIAAVGYGAAQPSLMGMALQCVPIAKRGVASNTLYIGMDSGYFLGPFLGGALYSVSNYATMYTLITVPVAVGLVLFIVLWPVYAKASAEARRADLESQRS
ncbi:MAG: MFS transporter, partial [Oscillospiraceae bacterium]|nr:MFS transporter [Oscillospiraceae bacterium]